jgi:hypothetical protein
VRRLCNSKKLKLISDGGDSGRKKCKRGCGDAYGGVWRSLRLVGVWSQAVGFVFVRLAGIWLVTVKMFSHLFYVIKKFYKFCTFIAICKDNTAINCSSVQYKKSFIPVNFDYITLAM